MIEEPDELPGAMAVLARANHLTIENVECGEKSCGAVALVIVSLTLRQAGPQREYWGSPIQCLNLALLIHTQHQRAFGRVQVQTHYISHFLFEAGIIGQFEALNPVRLNIAPLPDAMDDRPRNTEVVRQ